MQNSALVTVLYVSR